MASGYNNILGRLTQYLRVKSTGINPSSTPVSDVYGNGVYLEDSDGKRIFALMPKQNENGKIETQIYSVRTVSNTEIYNGITIGIKPDGTFENTFLGNDSYQAFLDMVDSGWLNVTAGADLDSGTLQYRKFGRVVILEGQTVKMKSSVGAGNRGTAGTLPSGFRPSKTAYGEAIYGHSSDLVEIGTNGTILIQLPTNWTADSACWFTVTFFTD